MGEKRVLGRVWCMLRLNFGGTNVSGAVPLDTHSTSFCCAPPDMGESDLIPVAVERLLSIEGADEIRIDVTFLRGKAPLPGADSPYQGEMSRRDKRGRDAVSEAD